MTYSDYLKGSNTDGMPEYRVAVLRNLTIEPLLPVIQAEVEKMGIKAVFYVGGYDTIGIDIRGDSLYEFAPQCILILQWGDRSIIPSVDVLKAIRERTFAPIIVNNLPIFPYPVMGIYDIHGDFESRNTLNGNDAIRHNALQFRSVYVLDFMRLFGRIGWDRATDYRHWASERMPFTPPALSLVGIECAKFIRAFTGHTKKCLVLDCDNTLWKGVVGEDGISGIAPYQEFQRALLALKNKGVLLSLCSKNNEEDVWAALGHSDSLLKKEDFVAWRINWKDKASNISTISAELNIGIDSLVFVDDSQFECDFIQKNYPEVSVMRFDVDQYTFSNRLLDSGLFDSLSVSDEDEHKTEMYQSDSQRRQLRESSSTLEDYLRVLEISVEITHATESTLPRLAQLSQKTNQFNLDTYRYTEEELRVLSNSGVASEVYSIRVKDKISDLGIVGMSVAWKHDDYYLIRSFMLSCRTLGRGIEVALLAHLVNRARVLGYTRVHGKYVASPKNSQVSTFYASHGFSDLGNGTWEWKEPEPIVSPDWIQVITRD